MTYGLLRGFCIRVIKGLSLCLGVALCLAGCVPDKSGEEMPVPSGPVTIYDDGVYKAERVDLIKNDQNGNVMLCLRFTNNSTDSVALSSVLGMRVSSLETRCSIYSVPESYQPLDGLVEVGESREGWVCFAAPAEQDAFTLELAVDYLDDIWITFAVSP